MPHFDSWGRKRPAFVFLFWTVVVALLTTFADSVRSFSVGLFFLGFCCPPTMMNANIWMQELVPRRLRPTLLIIAGVVGGVGFALMAIACMYTERWSWRNEARLWFSPFLALLLVGPYVTEEPPKDPVEAARNTDKVSFFEQFRALFFSPLCSNMLTTAVCWVAIV